MLDKPKIEVAEKPSLFNREALMGVGLGGLFGILGGAGLALIGVPPLPAYFGGFALTCGLGGLIGGSMGKARMEDEYKYGREAKPPSLFNWDMVIGALTLPLVIGLGIDAASTAGLIESGSDLLSTLRFAEGMSLFAGAIGGSVIGYQRQAKDYKTAELKAMERGQSNKVQINRAVGGPTRSTALAYEQNPYMNMRQDHASRVVDERMAAAQMPNQKV